MQEVTLLTHLLVQQRCVIDALLVTKRRPARESDQTAATAARSDYGFNGENNHELFISALSREADRRRRTGRVQTAGKAQP